MPGPEGPGDQALSGVCRGRTTDFLSRAGFALDEEATEVHHQAGHEEGTGDKSHPVEQGDLILACHEGQRFTAFRNTLQPNLQDAGSGFSADATGPAYDAARTAFGAAWGTDAVDIGLGGSIPFIAMFAEKFPQASILVTGVEDPDTRAHGANESLHLGEFEKVCVAEALLLDALAG